MVSDRNPGFTLVELLVVVTVIVLLMVLLAPALSRAVYQGQLAQCGAQQRLIATGLLRYALDHRRLYPYRGLPEQRIRFPIAPQVLTHPYEGAGGPASYDIRPQLRSFLNINTHLRDPFVEPVNLDYTGPDGANEVYILGSYHLWYGWHYKIAGRSYRGMYRIGDRFEYEGDRYPLLLSDPDIVFDGRGRGSSHPDRQWMANRAVEREPFIGGLITGSAWQIFTSLTRGPLDLNFTYDDTSVRRHLGVQSNWERDPLTTKNPEMTWLPSSYDGLDSWNNRSQVPRP
jgi:prepilin-type N-terminal cleavage/methylation domain-containing protein